jgi:hypothetical protein
MMGVASYREDIYLRFLESTAPLLDLPESGPVRESCPFCEQTFLTHSALLQHLTKVHRGDRPLLLIGGREPDAVYKIHHKLQVSRIVVRNCTNVQVTVDGRRQPPTSLRRIANLLAAQVDSTIVLELVNRFDAVAEPVRQLYRLQFRIPEKRSLDDVDRAFVEHLGTPIPTMEKVARFLEDRRCSGLSSDYADALAAYVRAVLVKDSDQNTGITLRPAEARALYGDALYRLRRVPRLLPQVISGLIRFAVNDFSRSEEPTGIIRIDRTVAFLAPLLLLKGPSVIPDDDSEQTRTVALCPIDHGLDRVLRLADVLLRSF